MLLSNKFPGLLQRSWEPEDHGGEYIPLLAVQSVLPEGIILERHNPRTTFK